jgi:predicted RecB family nuclease
MLLGKNAAAPLQAGDQFTRAEEAEIVWTVQRVITLPKLPKHAVMTCEGPVHRQILVSELILRDRRAYRPVIAEPPPGPAGGGGLWAGFTRLFGR